MSKFPALTTAHFLLSALHHLDDIYLRDADRFQSAWEADSLSRLEAVLKQANKQLRRARKAWLEEADNVATSVESDDPEIRRNPLSRDAVKIACELSDLTFLVRWLGAQVGWLQDVQRGDLPPTGSSPPLPDNVVRFAPNRIRDPRDPLPL